MGTWKFRIGISFLHSFYHSLQVYSHSLIIYPTSLIYLLDMGSRKTAAKRNPTSGRSGTRKSKENAPPTGTLKAYPKPRPTYKKAATAGASTDADIGNGEAAAVAALVSLRQPDSESAFNHTQAYQQIFNAPASDEEDLSDVEVLEDDEEEEGHSEDEEDQLMESENDNGKLRIHVIDILLDSSHQILTSLLVPHVKSDRNSAFHLRSHTKMLHEISPESQP